MTPEIEAALSRIGWQTVKRLPIYLISRAESVLSPTGGRFTAKTSSAKLEHDRLANLLGQLNATVAGLKQLSHKQIRSIDGGAATDDELQSAAPPSRIRAAVSALEGIVPGVEHLCALVNIEAGTPKKGAPRNEAAYRIAKVLAEIYVVGLGEKPTIGLRADGTGPSGLYGSVASDVFRLLSITVNDVRAPCREAIGLLDEGKMQMLLRIRELPPSAHFGEKHRGEKLPPES